MSRPRLLMANVHFAPWSYGGGTIVVQAMAQRLAREHGWGAGCYDLPGTPHHALYGQAIQGQRCRCRRYLPSSGPDIQRAFRQSPVRRSLRARCFDLQPGCGACPLFQNMGATFFRHFDSRKIPFAVTIHDAWWWCERQFMVMEGDPVIATRSRSTRPSAVTVSRISIRPWPGRTFFSVN